MNNTSQQINKNLLAALQALVSDWERVHGEIPEDHEAKVAIREAQVADPMEGKYYVHCIWGLFGESSKIRGYVMTKRADGWYAVNKNGDQTFVDKPDCFSFHKAVANGDWVETTLEKAFGDKY